MPKKIVRRLFVFLFFTIIICSIIKIEFIFSYVQSESEGEKLNDLPPLPTLTDVTNNQIIKFNATGENSRGDKFSVTENGGIIEINESVVNVYPWKHLFWIEKKTDVFFLANVTSTNFLIAFLYLTNKSTSFEVKIFDYKSATYQNIIYSGNGITTKNPSPVKNFQNMKLNIEPQNKIENRLFATGSDLFVTGDTGLLKEKTSILHLYTLKNTINTKLEWNELWSLLVGESGDYYFSIIYLNSAHKDKIILGHTLRLNDYYPLEQRQLIATWSMKGEVYQLGVNAPQEVKSLLVDDFLFQRKDDLTFKVILPKGNHTLTMENTTVTKDGKRLKFIQWSDAITTNHRTINMKSDLLFNSEYSKEFFLTIESAYKGITGGWYSEGQKVQIPSLSSIEQEEIKYYFTGWTGDIKSESNTTYVIMDSPKNIKADWVILFKITLNSEGLPPGTRVIYQLNDRELESISPNGVQDWIKEYSQINPNLDLPDRQIMKEQLFLRTWKRQNGSEILLPIQATAPMKLIAVFTNQKQTTNLSCRISTRDLLTLGRLRIDGEITPPFKAKVMIEYRTSGEPWKILTDVETNELGIYSYYWQPDVSGILYIRTIWSGDDTHNAYSSEPQIIAISQSMLKFKKLTGTFSNSTFSFYEELKGPKSLERTLRLSFSFGMNIVDYIYANLANLKPLGPIAVIIIGSAIMGIFYIFPWIAIIMVLIVIITKWAISRKILLPFTVIWVLCFSYLVLEELNATDLLRPPQYLLSLFTSGLVIATALITAFLPSARISNTLLKRWKTKTYHNT